jgi:hypothetical protein
MAPLLFPLAEHILAMAHVCIVLFHLAADPSGVPQRYKCTIRKYNNINITEISRDMCYVLTTIKSVLMFRIQARSPEYSRTLVTFNSSFSFEIISPTNSIIQVHFRCLPFAKCSFRFPGLFWRPALEGFAFEVDGSIL